MSFKKILLLLTALTALAIPSLKAQTSFNLAPRGNVMFRFANDFFNVTEGNGIQIHAFGRALVKAGGTGLSFPISGGILDLATAAGEIVQQGGIRLVYGPNHITLSDFDIEISSDFNAAVIVSGLLTVNGVYVGIVRLFEVELPQIFLPLTPRPNGMVIIPGVNFYLSAQAANLIDNALGNNIFPANLLVASGKIKAAIQEFAGPVTAQVKNTKSQIHR